MRAWRARSLPALLHAVMHLCRRAARTGAALQGGLACAEAHEAAQPAGRAGRATPSGGRPQAGHGCSEGDLAVGRLGYPNPIRKAAAGRGGTSTMRAVLVRSSMAPTLVTTSSAVTATKYATPSAMICAPRAAALSAARGAPGRRRDMSLRCALYGDVRGVCVCVPLAHSVLSPRHAGV